MKNFGYLISLVWLIYVVGYIFYHANDVGCNPEPIGVLGAIKIISFVIFLWFLGWGSKKIEEKYD